MYELHSYFNCIVSQTIYIKQTYFIIVYMRENMILLCNVILLSDLKNMKYIKISILIFALDLCHG